MYQIERHITKTGKLSSQWNVLLDGELVTRCCSKKLAILAASELNTLLNRENNEHRQKANQEIPAQQRDARADVLSAYGISGSDNGSLTVTAGAGSFDPKESRDSLDSRAVQIQERLSAIKRSRSEDSEPHPELPVWIRKLNQDVQSGLNEQHQLVLEQGQLVRRQAESTLAVIGIAESLARTNVGRTESGIEEQIPQLVLEVETIDVASTEI